MEALVAKNQLRFLGHLHHRKDASLPKQTVYEALGGPKIQLKDQLKQFPRKIRIPANKWEPLAANCSTWRGTITIGVQKPEAGSSSGNKVSTKTPASCMPDDNDDFKSQLSFIVPG